MYLSLTCLAWVPMPVKRRFVPAITMAKLGPVLAGQTNSVFMDVDVFPNVLDYWGPGGMVFLRNPQLRYTPIEGPTTVMIALGKPGASGDQGTIADRIDLSNIRGRSQYPDLTGAVSYTWKNKSYLRAAMGRECEFEPPFWQGCPAPPVCGWRWNRELHE